jgi:hypothetical protein
MNSVGSLIAVLGVGSIVAALIGWGVSISNHRQAWINALRDDLASFIKELEGMHYAIGDLLKGDGNAVLEEKKRQARMGVLFVYWRIVLRLNRTEAMHAELIQRLDALMTVTEITPNKAMIDEAIDLARRILKREWEVTKYGAWIADWRARHSN